jgi:hypothetical protein
MANFRTVRGNRGNVATDLDGRDNVATWLLIWMDVTIFMHIVCRKSDGSCFVKGCRV